MLKSFKIFKLFGIDVKLHWSWLFIFLLFIDFGSSASKMLTDAFSVVLIFSFVLIHEFGHIFAARRYGFQTNMVVLSLLGGVAFIERLDELTPKQSLWVSFAGPLTNIIMFILCIPLVMYSFSDVTGEITIETLTNGQYLALISIIVNAMMFIFNLLPIYPMDGGRLLRSTLELFNVKQSFIISIRITQLFCALLVVWAFWVGSITGGFIGILFFITAVVELRRKKDEDFEAGYDPEVRIKIAIALERCETDEDKLLFLDMLETNAKIVDDEEHGDGELFRITKNYIDGFRKDIKGTGDNG